MAGSEPGWHGWSHENSALFIAPTGQGDHVGLFMQEGRSTALLAVFIDVPAAAMAQDWIDGSMTATAAANSQLVDRLQQRLPLLPAATGMLHPAGRDDVDDLDDDL